MGTKKPTIDATVDLSKPDADVSAQKAAAVASYRVSIAGVDYSRPVVTEVYLDTWGRNMVFSDPATAVDSVAFRHDTFFGDSVSAGDSLSFRVDAKLAADSVIAADTVTLRAEFRVTISETVLSADTVYVDHETVFEDFVTATDAVTIILEIGFDHILNGEAINTTTIN